MTITHTYSSIAEKSPECVAIHTESEQITYQDWALLVSQTANWSRSPLSMPKRVAILLPNSLAFYSCLPELRRRDARLFPSTHAGARLNARSGCP